jgi:hypothetical protein
LTASIDVLVDGVCVLRTGGVLKFWGTQTAEFKHNGENHVLKLSWRSPAQGCDFPYTLSIDDEPVIKSRVRPRNWLMLLVPFAAAAAIWFVVHWLRAI